MRETNHDHRIRRVSTNDQDLSSQLDQLKQAGATKIYREKISGARSDRPELAKLMRSLGHGDVLLVTRLDRLARSTSDLLNVLDAVSKAGAAFKSLAPAICSTSWTPSQRPGPPSKASPMPGPIPLIYGLTPKQLAYFVHPINYPNLTELIPTGAMRQTI